MLRVYTLAGEVLSLGRYHLAPAPRPEAGAHVIRRHSGGRAMPWGNGLSGVSLVLPHRSALVAAEPLALAPEQVMNRYARGILRACELAGIAAFYPGRDLVTVDGRMLAMVSFAVEASGACIVEAVIADGHSFTDLPGLLDRVDPRGTVPATMVTSADATSVAERIGRALGLAEVAALLRRGYEERLGVSFAERVLAGEARFDADAWLAERRPRPELDRHAAIAGQLGVLDVHFALDQGRIRDVVLAGDVIAAAATVEGIEQALRGRAAEHAAVAEAVAQVLAASGSFLLGLGRPAAVADAIARGIAA